MRTQVASNRAACSVPAAAVAEAIWDSAVPVCDSAADVAAAMAAVSAPMMYSFNAPSLSPVPPALRLNPNR